MARRALYGFVTLGPLATLALGACNAETRDAGPGAVSEGEARALDEAARMLDEKRLPEEALPPVSQGDGDPPGSSQNSPTANNE
ncbi:MAG: hypothetical protein AAFY47_10475 [Pseudomonadota bacterium]